MVITGVLESKVCSLPDDARWSLCAAPGLRMRSARLGIALWYEIRQIRPSAPMSVRARMRGRRRPPRILAPQADAARCAAAPVATPAGAAQPVGPAAGGDHQVGEVAPAADL